MKNKIAILVTSCDKFSDLWSNNFSLLEKFWPNHPKAYLLSDKQNENGNKYFDKFLFFEKEFSSRLLESLEFVAEEYLLLTLDDYLISDFVDDNKIYTLLNYMIQNDVSYIRLFKRTKTKGWLNKEKKIHLLPLKKDAYEVNLYPSIWKKSDLINIIKNEENIWKFEVRMTRRCKEKHFTCGWVSNKKIFPFIDTVRKGKYLKKAHKYLKKNNLYISERKVRTNKENFALFVRTMISRHTPDFLQRKLKTFSKKTYFSDYAKTDD